MYDEYSSADPVAARVEALCQLIATLEQTKNKEVIKEALLLMGVVRRSIKTFPEGSLLETKTFLGKTLTPGEKVL